MQAILFCDWPEWILFYTLYCIFNYCLSARYMSKLVCYPTDQRCAGLCRYSPDKVHAQQSLFSVNGLSGPNSLIAYTDSLIVGSHFSPPHPGGLTENDGMGVLHLWDLDVCALQTQIREIVSAVGKYELYS